MADGPFQPLLTLKRCFQRRAKAAADPAREFSPWQGETVDVDGFWAEAWSELKFRQEELTRDLKLANASWRVNQASGLIEFGRLDGAIVRAPIQIIGTWNGDTEMFSWGWDHPSVHPRLRADAERTRWFGAAHCLPELVENRIKATEGEAWRLAAVAMRVNAAVGVYRAPTDGPIVFLNMGEPTLVTDPEE